MDKQLKEQIGKDIYRYYGKTQMPVTEKILPYNMGLKYIILFRKANYYYKKGGFLKFFYQYKLKNLA